jgi:DNA-binding FrmR family transcriptional regulator
MGIQMSHHFPAIIKRLRRADGHLRMIIEMIEKGRPCHQLAQQLQAVESAIENAKKALIHDHIEHCLERPCKVRGVKAPGVKVPGARGRAALREFKSIAKYL